MNEWAEGPVERNAILARIQMADSLTDLDACLRLLQRRFGFRFYKLFAQRPANGTSLRGRLLLYSVDEAFLDGFDAISDLPPTPDIILASAEQQLYQWSIDDLRCLEGLAPNLVELTQLLTRHDMLNGVYFALPALDGKKQIMSLYGDRLPLSSAEIEDFCFLAIHVLDRAGMLEKRLDGARAGMSNLEIRCLQMAASGLDTAAIAVRLSLSTRTVNYLVGSLCRKLNTDRLEQALRRAAQIGFI